MQSAVDPPRDAHNHIAPRLWIAQGEGLDDVLVVHRRHHFPTWTSPSCRRSASQGKSFPGTPMRNTSSHQANVSGESASEVSGF